MQKWTIENYALYEGYNYEGKIYTYLAELVTWETFANEIHQIRQWIKENNIDAIELSDDFTWAFCYEYDRTALLLTWSNLHD